MSGKEILGKVRTVLIIDWPSKDVPEALTLAGFQVVVKGGPGPTDYERYELDNGKPVSSHLGQPPDGADLVYSFRPVEELAEVISLAKTLHAHTIWIQSGVSISGEDDPKGCWIAEEQLGPARSMVLTSGLDFLSEPYIADVARELQRAA